MAGRGAEAFNRVETYWVKSLSDKLAVEATDKRAIPQCNQLRA